jgi:HD-GYP domain-containing protein (c-di-GMP phosphodiesterase class II)
MEQKRFPAITKKVVLYIVLADIILSSVIIATSYWAFNRQFREQYDTSIQEICAAAREMLNPDDFSTYLITKEKDAAYEAVYKILQDFVDKFDLNVIYVSAVEPPDYTHIFYFYDPVNARSKWSPYPLGYEEDYFEPNYNASTKRVFEEGATIIRHTIKTRSGSHITAQLPVYAPNGKIVAVIGVQKNIQEFVNARRSFVRFVIIAVFIFAVFLIILFSAYFNMKFIRPIMVITHETDRFASCRGEPSKELLEVTNSDELGILAHSVYKMEEVVVNNISALTRMTEETAASLATAIDAKDKYTHGHSTRVAEYSRAIARRAGKSELECRDIYISALLHDVGKIGIPNTIINKQGKLTDEEFKIIKTHPVIGQQILCNITQIPHIADGAFYHHERYDGNGYPKGLKGNDIPEIGRIIAVADAYDAMTSNRSYRAQLSQIEARSEIEKGLGSQFDPEYATILLSMIDEDKEYKMREND